jgi:hypothetical protein
MRHKLKTMNDERKRFTGEFVRFGTKRGWEGRTEPTVLLKGVVDIETGQKVTDHLWFNLTKAFSVLGLVEGDVIAFDARVTRYTKGYQGRRAEQRGEAWGATDYKLSRPTKVERVNDGQPTND